MFRIVARTIIILAVAGVICGGLYLLAQGDTGRALLGGNMRSPENRERPEQGFDAARGNTNRARPEPGFRGAPGNLAGQNPGVFPSPDMRERGGHGSVEWTRGLTGLTRNLGMIALLTLGVAVVQQSFAWVSRQRHAKPV
ncbi:MAG: hypothetical protein AB1817_21630 [Chloroflexota bacterium]